MGKPRASRASRRNSANSVQSAPESRDHQDPDPVDISPVGDEGDVDDGSVTGTGSGVSEGYLDDELFQKPEKEGLFKRASRVLSRSRSRTRKEKEEMKSQIERLRDDTDGHGEAIATILNGIDKLETMMDKLSTQVESLTPKKGMTSKTSAPKKTIRHVAQVHSARSNDRNPLQRASLDDSDVEDMLQPLSNDDSDSEGYCTPSDHEFEYGVYQDTASLSGRKAPSIVFNAKGNKRGDTTYKVNGKYQYTKPPKGTPHDDRVEKLEDAFMTRQKVETTLNVKNIDKLPLLPDSLVGSLFSTKARTNDFVKMQQYIDRMAKHDNQSAIFPHLVNTIYIIADYGLMLSHYQIKTLLISTLDPSLQKYLNTAELRDEWHNKSYLGLMKLIMTCHGDSTSIEQSRNVFYTHDYVKNPNVKNLNDLFTEMYNRARTANLSREDVYNQIKEILPKFCKDTLERLYREYKMKKLPLKSSIILHWLSPLRSEIDNWISKSKADSRRDVARNQVHHVSLGGSELCHGYEDIGRQYDQPQSVPMGFWQPKQIHHLSTDCGYEQNTAPQDYSQVNYSNPNFERERPVPWAGANVKNGGSSNTQARFIPPQQKMPALNSIVNLATVHTEKSRADKSLRSCVNCLKQGHVASECFYKTLCVLCNKTSHTASFCDVYKDPNIVSDPCANCVSLFNLHLLHPRSDCIFDRANQSQKPQNAQKVHSIAIADEEEAGVTEQKN